MTTFKYFALFKKHMDKKFGGRLLALTALALFLLTPQIVHAATADYNIVVNDAGDALVALNFAGSGEINVPLPLDVTNPEVKGALFVPAENGIDILVGPSGKSTVAYDTSILTAKSSGTWVFELDLVKGMNKKITLLLPPNAIISSTTPRGAIEQLSDSKKVTWSLSSAVEKVSLNYVLSERVPPKPPMISPLLLGVLGIVFIGIMAFSYMRPGLFQRPKPVKQAVQQQIVIAEETALISKEKKNVLKTLTENELKIVNNLLENSGSMKRNKLEHLTQMAKSSLASALANLERRNIVQLNRTFTVHTVELTEWFKNL